MVILFIVLISLVNAQDPADLCYECQNTYSYHESSKKCVKCQTKDGTANGVSICSECKTNGEQKCDSGKCAEGYYLETADGTNKNKCVACTANCKTCSTTGDEKCSVCQPGYTLVRAANSQEGHCIQCDDNCIKDQCTVDDECNQNQCKEGNYWGGDGADDHACHPCSRVSTGCTICSDANTCTTCGTGYYLETAEGDNKNKCVACIDHCTACENADTCKVGTEAKCAAGYSLVDDANNEGKQICVQCQTINGQTTGASICNTCSAEQKCNEGSCKEGYYHVPVDDAVEADRNTCKACPSNCKQCNNVHAKCDAAVNCDTGYGLSTDGQCVLCDTNCNDHQCTEANKCNANQCKPGYYRKDDGTCARCNSGTDDTSKLYYCDQCSDATHCTKCLEGENAGGLVTRLVNDECAICGLDCLKCTTSVTGRANSGLCDTDGCAPGFYYSDGLCPSCSTAITGCAECSDANTCTKCKTGYYLDESDHKCKRCNNKNEGTVASSNHCSKCTKDPEPPAPQDDSSVMVSIVLGLIALIALF